MSLKALFYPKSVAVIGASTHEGSVGNEIAKNLARQGYRGRLYFVNPKKGRIWGHSLISDLDKIKGPVDLAIIAIPAALVVDEVKRLLPLEVKAVVVISAGFGEAGNASGEAVLAKVCADNNITLIGPNCLGVLNPQIKLNASFAPLMPSFGPVAFVSQSGAICASVLDWAKARDLGFSKFVSVGNKALVGEAELLEFLYHDPFTRVIAMYVEELEEIEKLRETVVKITHGKLHKPIILLKAGRTVQGRKAALSHTGTMGGSDLAYEALFAQTGMIRAQTIEELFDFTGCFARNRVLSGNRVAVITNAGGPGVISADAIVEGGLRLAQLSSETRTKLRKFLPPAASVDNPVDILGDADSGRYELAIKTILADSGVDAVQIILTPQSMTEIEATARAIATLKKHSAKPLEVTFMGQGLVSEGVNILNRNKVATSYFPESATRALGALHAFWRWLGTRRGRPAHFGGIHPEVVGKILERFKGEKLKLLSMEEAYNVLEAYGLPVPERWMITSEATAADLASKLKGQFVLKIMSGDINHKSDVGGVVLGVAGADLVPSYKKLIAHVGMAAPKAKIDGVEVMREFGDEGVEIIIGVTTDRVLGKQVLVGLGGVYTEVFADVSWGLAPLTKTDIERMISHLKTAKILAGFRGHEPFASEKVAECLGRVSQLVCEFPIISEVDINPLKVMDEKKGAVILDTRMVLS